MGDARRGTGWVVDGAGRVIIQALVSFFAQSVRTLVGLIPSWSPPVDVFTGFASTLGAAAAKGNGYFPVAVLGVCVGMIFGLKIALLVWRVILFVYSVIPFKAT